MLVIGDVHGKVDQYSEAILGYEGESIQLGDFGFKKQHDWFIENIDSNKHKILFGNHDYYPYVGKDHSMGNYSYNSEMGIMTIRGAYSIDRSVRLEGRDWFQEEEMTYKQWRECVDFFEECKPKIVISHDCPHDIRKHLFYIYDTSITSNGLQQCLEVHQPDLWIFGHHHKSKSEIVDKTRFVCLEELEVIEI